MHHAAAGSENEAGTSLLRNSFRSFCASGPVTHVPVLDAAVNIINVGNNDSQSAVRCVNDLIVSDVHRDMGRIIGASVEDQVSGRKILVFDHDALLIAEFDVTHTYLLPTNFCAYCAIETPDASEIPVTRPSDATI